MSFPILNDAGIRRFDVEAPRYTSYPTVPHWTAAFGPEEHGKALERAGDVLSLYVHLPFCREMCTFCGCNMVVLRKRSQIDEYLDAVEAELTLVAERLGRRRRLSQLYWGGGTPTSLDEQQIERVYRMVEKRFDIDPAAEVAVEIDPTVTRPSQIELMRKLGFNRLSLGVQDLDPEVQQAINRIQTPEETEALLAQARELGYRGLNVDLIYGLPFQKTASWARTLERVIKMRPDRMAVYSFAYLPTVRKQQSLLPVHALPMGAEKLNLLRQAYEAFVGAGYVPIGMDHFAREDDGLAVAARAGTLRRNFIGYTAAADSEIVGVGATGISDVGNAYSQNIRPLKQYQAAVLGGRVATERGLALTEDDVRRRDIIQQIMCNFRVDLGPQGSEQFAGELARLRGPEGAGLAEVSGSEVSATPLGRVFVRNVAVVFDARYRPAGTHHARTV
jgi:oxygen-independent coproporphyrinogen-3 oxidase